MYGQEENLDITTNVRGDRKMDPESIKSVITEHVHNATIMQYGCLLMRNTALPHGGVQRLRAYPFSSGPCKLLFHTKNPQDVVVLVPDGIENVRRCIQAQL